MGVENTLKRAQGVAIAKEANDMIAFIELSKKINPKDKKALDTMGRVILEEDSRLNPTGTFDHEEVFDATGAYTTGRKVRLKPKLSKINNNKWLQTGG